MPVYTNCPECTAKDFTYLLMGDSGEVECKQTGNVYNSDKIVNNAEIPVQSVLTYNFHGTHRSGTLHSHLCDSSVFLFIGVRRSGATLICICSCLTADDDDDESSEDDDDDDDDDEESDGNEDKVQQAETAAAGDGQVEELSDRVEHLTSS